MRLREIAIRLLSANREKWRSQLFCSTFLHYKACIINKHDAATEQRAQTGQDAKLVLRNTTRMQHDPRLLRSVFFALCRSPAGYWNSLRFSLPISGQIFYCFLIISGRFLEQTPIRMTGLFGNRAYDAYVYEDRSVTKAQAVLQQQDHGCRTRGLVQFLTNWCDSRVQILHPEPTCSNTSATAHDY